MVKAGLVAASALIAECCPLWAPPPTVTLSQWAEENFILSSEYSAQTGPFRYKSYQREVLDTITDPRVQCVVIMCATQMMKTLAIQISLAYVMDRDPGPTLLIEPRDTDARAFSKERLGPMLRDVHCLTGKVTDGRLKSRSATDTLEYKKFPGGYLVLAASGSPGNMAGRSIRYFYGDEIDKWPPSAGLEGDPLSLGRKRTLTYRSRRKLIFTCSPTVAGRSRIAKAYEDSDQRKFWVPCSSCGEHQVLKFRPQVKWDHALPRERQAASAYYLCEHCGAHWDDAARWRAIESVDVWRAEKPFAGTAGFWISELYSERPLGEIVEDFLRAKNDRQQLRVLSTPLSRNSGRKSVKRRTKKSWPAARNRTPSTTRPSCRPALCS